VGTVSALDSLVTWRLARRPRAELLLMLTGAEHPQQRASLMAGALRNEKPELGVLHAELTMRAARDVLALTDMLDGEPGHAQAAELGITPDNRGKVAEYMRRWIALRADNPTDADRAHFALELKPAGQGRLL